MRYNMSLEYTESKSISLRDAGKDERWLQDFIAKRPSVLGLGDVELLHKERKQPSGGRIDLVLRDLDVDDPVRYEVEIMLGAVDASHIIRTIEYWDIERRRYPASQHRAVIIAEEITQRFFNVISLLNGSIPIIAIKLNAAQVGDKLVVNFIKVLDVIEQDEEFEGEQVDRQYWVKLGRSRSLETMDAALALFPKGRGELRIKYNRGHAAVGSSANNFLWVYPKKGNFIGITVNVGEKMRDHFLKQLEEAGIDCRPSTRHDGILVRALKVSYSSIVPFWRAASRMNLHGSLLGSRVGVITMSLLGTWRACQCTPLIATRRVSERSSILPASHTWLGWDT